MHKVKIGVVAPASRIDPAIAERVTALVNAHYSHRAEIIFHPQCFLSSGHFAGDDEIRARAFVEIANDASFGALWVARGGYGAGRILARTLPELTEVARRKTYLGYSDAGFLLGALYAQGFLHLAHGPMPVDLLRDSGEAAVTRSLAFLVDRASDTLEPSVAAAMPSAAFNMTVLSHILGTPYEPDLSGHVLMLEEVSEHMYRVDRALFHITSNPAVRRVAGIRLGRCSAMPPNEPEFGRSEEDVVRHWCDASGIAYLGRADIGHDVDNKIVPFGAL